MDEKHVSATVPVNVVQSLLREYLDDPTAVLVNFDAEPITSVGVSGNVIFRARIMWHDQQTCEAAWIIKQWRRGGMSEAELALTHSIEAEAWRHCLLRYSGDNPCFENIVTPYIGVYDDPDRSSIWIAMEDISADLDAYSRAHPLPVDEAIVRAKHILTRLASFHACWEKPAQQASLGHADWLLPLEDVLWKSAATYAHALEETPEGGKAKGCDNDPTLPAKLGAFLNWLPAGDRSLWRDLLCDRRALVAAFHGLPETLLHGDLDDRNIGLRWSDSVDAAPELLLIDWEWMGLGPAALDVAKIVHHFLAMCITSPNALRMYPSLLHELPAHYLEQYLAAGGKRAAPGTWRRSFGLSLISEHMTPFPHVVGSLILANEAGKASNDIPGTTFDDFGPILEWADISATFVTAEIRRWLS